SKVTQDGAELLTLPVRLDRDATEQPLLSLVVAGASQHDLERSNLIASDRLHMAAIERHRDRLNGWWAGQWLGCQRLLLQSGAHPKGPAACRLDRGRLVQRKELRHQSRRAAIGGQAPHFDENALVFLGASIRHYLGQRAHDPARGDSTAAGIEARRLDFHDSEQCRQLSRAPVLDGTTGPSMRTFSPMSTISIDLGLNQLGLHGGKNGFALGQSQTDRLWRRRICRSVAGNHFVRLHVPVCLCQLQQNPPLHSIPQVNNDPKPIPPPSLRRSHVSMPARSICGEPSTLRARSAMCWSRRKGTSAPR